MWVVVGLCSDGVSNVIGPFQTEDEAKEYIASKAPHWRSLEAWEIEAPF